MSGSTNKGAAGYLVNFDVKNSATIKVMAIIVFKGKVNTVNINTKGGVTPADSPAPSSTASAQADGACLTPDIVRKSTSSAYAPSLYRTSGFQGGITVFFQSDTIEFDAETASLQISDITTFGDWAKTNASRKFHLEITGKVQGDITSAAGTQLAASRTDKIKQALMARGVAESQIKIMPYESKPGTDALTQSARRTSESISLAIAKYCS